jgi:hypothetical protein
MMNALGISQMNIASAHPSDRPRHSTRFSLDYDDLEDRQLLSAAVPTTAQEPAITPASGAPGPVAPTGTLTSLGNSAATADPSSVVTQSTGAIGSLQSSLALNNLPANLSDATVAVYQTPGDASVATGLASDPISPLLPLSVTEQENPLDNGTPISGTVWITPPPVSPGAFHTGITVSPVVMNQYNSQTIQPVNPQLGSSSITHFGQNAGAAMAGAATQQSAATGPLGPSITAEVEPQQPVGPPTQVQPDQTTPQPNATMPSSGQPAATQPGNPSQGTAPGQQGAATQAPAQSPQSSQESSPAPAQPTSPSQPAGQGSESDPAGTSAPRGDAAASSRDQTLDLIDASITSLASQPADGQPADDNRLAAFAAAAVIATSTYQFAYRGLRKHHN